MSIALPSALISSTPFAPGSPRSAAGSFVSTSVGLYPFSSRHESISQRSVGRVIAPAATGDQCRGSHGEPAPMHGRPVSGDRRRRFGRGGRSGLCRVFGCRGGHSGRRVVVPSRRRGRRRRGRQRAGARVRTRGTRGARSCLWCLWPQSSWSAGRCMARGFVRAAAVPPRAADAPRRARACGSPCSHSAAAPTRP